MKRLTNLLEALAKYAEEWREEQLKPKTEPGRRGPEVEVMTSGELMQKLGRKAEGVNLLEIEKYLRESKVCRMLTACGHFLTASRSRARSLGILSRSLRERRDKVRPRTSLMQRF